MPISDPVRAAVLVAGLAALAGCESTGGSGTAAATRTSVDLAGDRIEIVGPSGFCIDRDASNTGRDSAFVLLSDCRLLSNRAGGEASPMQVALTASISAGGLIGEGDASTASLAELSEFLATAQGRTLLARSGRGDRVRLLATRTRGEVLYVLVEDRGPQPIGGIEPQFWRAFLDLNDNMVALSVVGFDGGGIDTQEGYDLLTSFSDRLQAANPG